LAGRPAEGSAGGVELGMRIAKASASVHSKNREMPESGKLIPLHGGYRKLKSFQVAREGKAEG